MSEPKYALGPSYDDKFAGLSDRARIAELEQQLAELREAADRYSANGHFPDCRINDINTGNCTCGLVELAPLLPEE